MEKKVKYKHGTAPAVPAMDNLSHPSPRSESGSAFADLKMHINCHAHAFRIRDQDVIQGREKKSNTPTLRQVKNCSPEANPVNRNIPTQLCSKAEPTLQKMGVSNLHVNECAKRKRAKVGCLSQRAPYPCSRLLPILFSP